MEKLLIKAAITIFVTCFAFSCQRTAPPLTVGDPVEITAETIGTNGGTILVDKPGDPLDGFAIEVPAGTYDAAQTFTISYQPIESYNLPEGSVPISPLISVENGGQFSRNYMTMTIPVSIPQDHFAMAFFYDEESLKLEGMYRVTADNGSITAGTRHFSKCAVVATPLKSLEGFIDTEFKPGQDDWQFTNHGSYIAPAGHCAGQSIMAMYYFTEKKLKEGKPALYGTYDNDGNPYHKTPDLQHDDVLGYKVCSVAQLELGFNVDLFDTTWYDQKKNDVETYMTFAEAMLLTGEPQFVTIYRTNQKGNKTGHAMIAYKESRRTNSRGREEGVLHIADPNFPGQEREIVINFDNGSFVPYYSGAKAPESGAAFNLRAYSEIYFKEKQDLLVAQTQGKLLWDAFENETIGNQDFPAYTLYVCRKNSDYSVTRLGQLYDGYKITGYDFYCFDVDVDGATGALWIYDEQAQGIIAYEKASVRLKEGDNLLGFHVVADATYTNADQETVTEKEWVGFKWVNVIYQEKDDATTTTSVATSTTTAPEDEGDLDAEACCAVDGIDYRVEITVSPESNHWAILCESKICFTNTLTDWVGLYMHQKRGTQEDAWYGQNFPPGELCQGFSRTLQPGVQQDAYYALETTEFTATYSGNPQDGYQIGERCKWIGDDVSGSDIRTVHVESMNPCD